MVPNDTAVHISIFSTLYDRDKNKLLSQHQHGSSINVLGMNMDLFIYLFIYYMKYLLHTIALQVRPNPMNK